MKYQLAIFDLDGTILDTLEDLWTSGCYALRCNGMPERTIDEVRSFVGNGIRNYMRRAVPEGTSEELLDRVHADFTAHYAEHCADHTKPYAGIPELLTALRSAGMKTAVVSNKADYGVQTLIGDYFPGMASIRCSELGYWNFFTPVLDYSDIRSYADSIEAYVTGGVLRAPSELYYPVRLKPRGKNTLDNLRSGGVSHIELRMFDLNPLAFSGVAVRDVKFAQLLLIYLAAGPAVRADKNAQIMAVRNFKSAARYDLRTVRLASTDGNKGSLHEAGLRLLQDMETFFRDCGRDVQCVLDFELEKFTDPERRYAAAVKEKYAGGFVRKGLVLARQRQEESLRSLREGERHV